MGLAIGFSLFVLGLVTFWGWMPATLDFLKGMVAFSLLFWGFVAMLVGFSERKAKREFNAALQDRPSPVETMESE
jgi:cytochrome c biogenesis protein CcdA